MGDTGSGLVEITSEKTLSDFIDLEANIGYYFVASASPSGDCEEKIHLGVRVDDTVFTESQLGASHQDKTVVYMSTDVVDEVQEIQLNGWQTSESPTEDQVKIALSCTTDCVYNLFN